MTAYTVHELVVPATMDDDPGTVQAFREWVDVQNRAEVSITGLPELLWTPEEQLPYLIDPDAPSRLFLVRDDEGTAVGAGSYDSKATADAPNCWLAVSVAPEHRRRGIGTLLAGYVEDVARQQGRTQWKTYAVSRHVGAASGPGFLRAPTGYGAVPEDEPGVRFLAGRGWRFGQVNRISRLELPADPDALAGIRAAATRAAGDRYRVHTWAGPTPLRWQTDVALLLTRMSTDAPSGDMAEPEDAWTVDRLRTHEQHLDDGPRMMRTVAVEDVSSGGLVGFTQLAVPGPVVQPVMQGDTLVLREHRGHRLGWLLKVVGIETIERDHPGHPSIITFNAEENRPMLDVNEAVGFVGVGGEGIWEHRPA